MSKQVQIQHVLDILVNLDFIASIEPGDKIYVSDKIIIKPTHYNRLIRTFSGEKGDYTYEYVLKTVQDSIEFIETSDKTNTTLNKYVKEVIDKLESAQRGIDNLSESYNTKTWFGRDTTFFAKKIKQISSQRIQKALEDYKLPEKLNIDSPNNPFQFRFETLETQENVGGWREKSVQQQKN